MGEQQRRNYTGVVVLHSCRLRPMIGLLREREEGWTFAARRRLRSSPDDELFPKVQAVDTFVASAQPWKPTELGCPECGGTVRIRPSRLGQRAEGREVVVD